MATITRPDITVVPKYKRKIPKLHLTKFRLHAARIVLDRPKHRSASLKSFMAYWIQLSGVGMDLERIAIHPRDLTD